MRTAFTISSRIKALTRLRRKMTDICEWQAWIEERGLRLCRLKGKGEIKPEMPEKLAPAGEKELKVKGWPSMRTRSLLCY